jgi:hypothetical protein
MRVRRLVALLAAVILAAIVAGPAPAAMISVHYTEGVTRGFLVLRSLMVLRNLPKGAAETVHVLAFTPKPTLVQLEMRPIAEENVLVGARRVPATHFVLKPKLGLSLLDHHPPRPRLREHRRPALHRRADLALRDGEPTRAPAAARLGPLTRRAQARRRLPASARHRSRPRA